MQKTHFINTLLLVSFLLPLSTYALPTVDLTVPSTAFSDEASVYSPISCDDDSTPSVANLYCRSSVSSLYPITPEMWLYKTLSWTSSDTTSCQFLPVTDSFLGSRPLYEGTPAQYTAYSVTPRFDTSEALPTSGSRKYMLRGGVNQPITVRYAYNNVSTYSRTITISCTDGLGNIAQDSVTITSTDNTKPHAYAFGVAGVQGGGNPGIFSGERLAPYTTDLLIHATSGMYSLYSSNTGVDSITWRTTTVDNSLDLDRLLVSMKKVDQIGNETDAPLSEFQTTDPNDAYYTPQNPRRFNITDAKTLTFIQRTPAEVYADAYASQFNSTAKTAFNTLGTYKLGYSLYDTSITLPAQAPTPGVRLTITTLCPPGHEESGSSCVKHNPTVTIIEHGTDTGPNTGPTQQFAIDGTTITARVNKTSSSLNGPTLTIALGSSTQQSVFFDSVEHIDSVQLYNVSPSGATNTGGYFAGASNWNYATPPGSPSGWWYYKTNTVNSDSLSNNITSIQTRRIYPGSAGFDTYSMDLRMTNNGKIVQDRPDTGIHTSDEITGVHNATFVPQQLGLHKVCAVVYMTYDSNDIGTHSCYNLQVNCPVGQTQQGSICVASGPPSFTLSAYIQGKPSDPNTPQSSGVIESSTNDGSYHEWRYIIGGTTPANCNIKRRSDGGAWTPVNGYATDVNGYTSPWANLTVGVRQAFMVSYNTSHEWQLTCTDSLNRTGSLIWKLNKVANPPTVLSANVNNNCQGLPPTPTLTVSCADADYFEAVDTTSGSVMGSLASANGSIPIPGPGTWDIICRNGGPSGSASTDNIQRTYDVTACDVNIQSFVGTPKTIKSGGTVALSWVIEKPVNTCTISASPVCSGTCSPLRVTEASTLSNRFITENTDRNDANGAERSIAAALSTNVITDGSTPKAIGKKTVSVLYTTDFTLSCGTVDKKIRVKVSTDSEG